MGEANNGNVLRPEGGEPVSGKISASIMCSDALNLEADLRAFEKLGVEYLHVDIMDGCFVPNYAFGTDLVKRLKGATAIPLDIHLLIDQPEHKLDWFAFGENDNVSFHCEATQYPGRIIRMIKDRGAQAMVALNPGTPPSALEEVEDLMDAILVMTVNPGFAGQKLVESTITKMAVLRKMYPGVVFEADGNVSFENAVRMRAAGADVFVAGSSSIFSPGGLEANMQKLRECIV